MSPTYTSRAVAPNLNAGVPGRAASEVSTSERPFLRSSACKTLLWISVPSSSPLMSRRSTGCLSVWAASVSSVSIMRAPRFRPASSAAAVASAAASLLSLSGFFRSVSRSITLAMSFTLILWSYIYSKYLRTRVSSSMVSSFSRSSNRSPLPIITLPPPQPPLLLLLLPLLFNASV